MGVADPLGPAGDPGERPPADLWGSSPPSFTALSSRRSSAAPSPSAICSRPLADCTAVTLPHDVLRDVPRDDGCVPVSGV